MAPSQHSEESQDSAPSQEKTDAEDLTRRDFIKKLPYVAPIISTYLLEETAFAGDKKKGRGRRRGRTSPHPRTRRRI